MLRASAKTCLWSFSVSSAISTVDIVASLPANPAGRGAMASGGAPRWLWLDRGFVALPAARYLGLEYFPTLPFYDDLLSSVVRG